MTADPPDAYVSHLSRIFKAYDVRGLCPPELTAGLAERIGAAYARLVADTESATRVVIGHDMRPTSPELAAALAAGVTAQGLDAVALGLTSTDQLYFASGWQECPGIMVTASHNPAAYNGLKFCRTKAAPIGLDTGLAQVRDAAATGLPTLDPPGRRTELDSLPAYAQYLHSLVPLGGNRPMTVVVDAGNGMAGHTVPAVFAGLPVTVVPMYFELDGTFPNHPADPLDPANLVDLQKAVPAERADLGLAFDGDADRCFIVDERGEAVSPSVITALIAERELARSPGSSVVHNVITSRTVTEVIEESGGTAVRTRVGHSNMKAAMAESGAIFGGEHSAHYYFRDFWGADTGILAAMHLLAALGETDGTLSQLVARYQRYVASGEINSSVGDVAERIAVVRAYAEALPGATIDDLDGVTVGLSDDAWFSVRGSNTEPLLRLNVEARDAARMEAVRDEMLVLIRSDPGTR